MESGTAENLDFKSEDRGCDSCFRQGANDSVGHEFWTRDGLILFDNRGPGHDGTITSDKKQICAETEIKEGYPYFGFADKNGEVLRTTRCRSTAIIIMPIMTIPCLQETAWKI